MTDRRLVCDLVFGVVHREVFDFQQTLVCWRRLRPRSNERSADHLGNDHLAAGLADEMVAAQLAIAHDQNPVGNGEDFGQPV